MKILSKNERLNRKKNDSEERKNSGRFPDNIDPEKYHQAKIIYLNN
jgi:hypothetical protein